MENQMNTNASIYEMTRLYNLVKMNIAEKEGNNRNNPNFVPFNDEQIAAEFRLALESNFLV